MTPAEKESRKGNGGDSFFKFVMNFAIPILSVMFGIGMAYSSINSSVSANSRQIGTNCDSIKILDTSTRVNREEIIKIQSDVQYIKRGVDEIKASLRDHTAGD